MGGIRLPEVRSDTQVLRGCREDQPLQMDEESYKEYRGCLTPVKKTPLFTGSGAIYLIELF